MDTCVIFCAGGFDRLIEPIGPECQIVAADAGLRHLEALGLTPTRILGDFDSLGYVPPGAEVYPVEKDDTDAMLAARYGLAAGFRRFLFYGSLDGPRLDHTVANFQTLQFLADRGAHGYLVGLTSIAALFQNETAIFPVGCTGTLSLFCLGPDARGVTLEGLKYPMTDGTLTAGFPLGVSNHFTGREAVVHVPSGSLLAIYSRSNGFPVRRKEARNEQT